MRKAIVMMLLAIVSNSAMADIWKCVGDSGVPRFLDSKTKDKLDLTNCTLFIRDDSIQVESRGDRQKAIAETVYVKYRGPVDLAPFECEWISRSSVVKRLCYDSKEKYVIVNLTGTYYHYCEVPARIIADWQQAESMGRYYNAQVKGRFDCRVLRVPPYKN